MHGSKNVKFVILILGADLMPLARQDLSWSEGHTL